MTELLTPTARAGVPAWLVVTLAAVLVVAIVALLEPVRVDADSMAPTLHDGDRVLVDKVSDLWRDPRVGDVVVFHDPRGDLAIKRVVALPGDDIALEDGVLVVNGVARQEPEVVIRSADSVYFGPVTVPPESVFLLGDNRAPSIDSRDYGAIAVRDLVGRVVAGP